MTREEELIMTARSLRATERVKQARACSLTRHLEERAAIRRAMGTAPPLDGAWMYAERTARAVDVAPRTYRRTTVRPTESARPGEKTVATAKHNAGISKAEDAESPLAYFDRLAAETMGLA